MRRFALGLVLAMVVTAAQPQQEAGRVLFAAGESARVAADGSVRPLARGDAVYEGDTVRTAPGSHLQLRMRDDAFLALRPDSELRLAAYRERALLDLLKGGLRSITGAIGRRDHGHYRMQSHRVVLGIRGTDHEARALPQGFYDRVVEGGTYLQTPEGRVDVDPGRTGFAPRGAGAPSLLESTPDFLLAVLPDASPHSGPPPRDRSPLDLKLPALPAVAPFDAPPVGGPLERPGADVTGAGTGARPSVLLPRPNGKGRN